MIGLVLLYVGCVLFINGLTMLGHISNKESIIMNIFTGLLAVTVAIYNIFVVTAGVASAAYGLLFAFTYLWVAYNNITLQDGRGLGWFSLFVAITATAVTYDTFISAHSIRDFWLAINWGCWVVLWFGFFLLGACGKTSLTRPIAYLAIAEGIFTAWVPGYLLLSGHMPA
jgi:hypothetical protein|tara:strand:- start:2393 stop:2902 length:510 start_codon:yes stop_codon:yes gene_type:complete